MSESLISGTMNGDVFCSAPGDGMSVTDSKGIAVGLNVCSRHVINMGSVQLLTKCL